MQPVLPRPGTGAGLGLTGAASLQGMVPAWAQNRGAPAGLASCRTSPPPRELAVGRGGTMVPLLHRLSPSYVSNVGKASEPRATSSCPQVREQACQGRQTCPRS